MISAWQSVCTPIACNKAAEKAGWFPFSEEAAASSPYARETTEAEDAAYLNRRQQRARLDINSRIINTPEFIDVIANKLRENPLLGHLAEIPPPTEPWVSICTSICKNKLNNKNYFIGKIPVCAFPNGHFAVFDQ